MEFIKTSKKVEDIRIPEGNVIKIEEAKTGRILWEKGLYFEPVGKYSQYNRVPTAVFDDGSKLVFFISQIYDNNDIALNPSWFTYIPSSGKFSNLTTLTIPRIECIGMHPNNKKWIAFFSRGMETSAGIARNLCKKDGTKFQWYDDNDFYDYLYRPNCCWVSHLNRFCIADDATYKYELGSVLFDEDGYYTERYLTNFSSYDYPLLYNNNLKQKNAICYSLKLKKILLMSPFVDGKTCKVRILTSTDGLKWSFNSNNPPLISSTFFDNLLWLEDLNIFIALTASDKNIYQSIDGITWTLKSTAPAKFLTCAWSPTKKVFCGITCDYSYDYSNATYITKDFVHWSKVGIHGLTGKLISGYGSYLIWSNTANAFILTGKEKDALFYKLDI